MFCTQPNWVQSYVKRRDCAACKQRIPLTGDRFCCSYKFDRDCRRHHVCLPCAGQHFHEQMLLSSKFSAISSLVSSATSTISTAASTSALATQDLGPQEGTDKLEFLEKSLKGLPSECTLTNGIEVEARVADLPEGRGAVMPSAAMSEIQLSEVVAHLVVRAVLTAVAKDRPGLAVPSSTHSGPNCRKIAAAEAVVAGMFEARYDYLGKVCRRTPFDSEVLVSEVSETKEASLFVAAITSIWLLVSIAHNYCFLVVATAVCYGLLVEAAPRVSASVVARFLSGIVDHQAVTVVKPEILQNSRQISSGKFGHKLKKPACPPQRSWLSCFSFVSTDLWFKRV